MKKGKLHEYNGRNLTVREWAKELRVSVRFLTLALSQGWLVEDIALKRWQEKPRRERKIRRWTADEDSLMDALALKGESPRDIALKLGRSPMAVSVRIAAKRKQQEEEEG